MVSLKNLGNKLQIQAVDPEIDYRGQLPLTNFTVQAFLSLNQYFEEENLVKWQGPENSNANQHSLWPHYAMLRSISLERV